MRKIILLIFLIVFASVSNAQDTQGYRVISHDKERNILTIKLDEHLSSGTDASCCESARILHDLCSAGYTVKVVGYCPSLVNPMTVEWTEKLINSSFCGEPISNTQ